MSAEEAQEYVVQSGDTLALIAMKFDVSADWLKKINHLSWSDMIFPGDVLLIKSEAAKDTFVEPISVTLFDVNDKDVVETPGKLLIVGDTLRFESPQGKPVVINLADIIESAILMHPFTPVDIKPNDPDAQFLLSLTVSCLTDGKPDTHFWYFAGKSAVVRSFQEKLVEHMDRANEELMERQQTMLSEESAETATSDVEPATHPDVEAEVQPHEAKEPEKSVDVAPAMVRTRQIKKMPDSKMIGTSVLLKREDVCEIRAYFPHRYRGGTWRLLYCLSKDGCSYRTFFSRTERKYPVVMVLQTDSDERIGCFVSCGFTFSRNYYGSGETFVFKMQPKIEIFKWAQSNEFFTCSSENEIAIGGGGASAIWIGGNLLNAFSESCPTFNSPSLTKEMRFKVVDLEVWQIEGGP